MSILKKIEKRGLTLQYSTPLLEVVLIFRSSSNAWHPSWLIPRESARGRYRTDTADTMLYSAHLPSYRYKELTSTSGSFWPFSAAAFVLLLVPSAASSSSSVSSSSSMGSIGVDVEGRTFSLLAVFEVLNRRFDQTHIRISFSTHSCCASFLPLTSGDLWTGFSA